MKISRIIALVLACSSNFMNAEAAWVGKDSDISYLIHSQIDQFSKHVDNSSVNTEHVEVNGKNFYGIDQKNLNKTNYVQLKTDLINKMGLKTRRMVQIVGSSNQFSVEGTQLAREFLKPYFDGEHIIEYGYTGHINDDLSKLDINSFLNEYIEQNPNETHRVLANVVGHTFTALNLWGCKVSDKVSNFVVVYNDYGMQEGFTKFGDDVIASDYIMSAEDDDLLVIVEGGPQSFRQAVNVLEKGVNVVALGNVREEKDRKFFSTAEFFDLVKTALLKNLDLTGQDIKQILDSYLSNHEAWDPTRPDASTKEGLFYSTVADFINRGIYKKLLNRLDVRIVE
ncbi:MAG: hypothetical protein Q8L85_01550 [Alphaproteobacteria bacterium]|nr:hypothetical protein [Alphaproteobacteria bacterium]